MAPMKLKNEVVGGKIQNLCFVNTSVQMLASLPEFRQYFVERKYRDTDNNNRDFTVSDQLCDIFTSNGQIAVSCNNLRSSVATKSQKQYLASGNQQDLLEFSIALLDVLEQEFDDANCVSGLALVRRFVGNEVTHKAFQSP